MSWWQRSNEEPGSVHFCTWATDSDGHCLRASCRAARAEAAIARVQELCADRLNSGFPEQDEVVADILRTLKGGV